MPRDRARHCDFSRSARDGTDVWLGASCAVADAKTRFIMAEATIRQELTTPLLSHGSQTQIKANVVHVDRRRIKMRVRVALPIALAVASFAFVVPAPLSAKGGGGGGGGGGHGPVVQGGGGLHRPVHGPGSSHNPIVFRGRPGGGWGRGSGYRYGYGRYGYGYPVIYRSAACRVYFHWSPRYLRCIPNYI